MKNKYFFVIIAIILAVVGSYKGLSVYSHNSMGYSNLLKQNVEALSEDGNEDYLLYLQEKCLRNGHNWNMSSVSENFGFESVECTIEGKITVLGFTIEGDFKKGETHRIPWVFYKCVPNPNNCCEMQGLYALGKKLA